jgi:predicted AlkP superfamily pyrophosphatase or phosphodiesterase
MKILGVGAACAAALIALGLAQPTTAASRGTAFKGEIRHALVISVDGMHASDFDYYVGRHADSAMAQLARRGITFPNARTPVLGDSSPGLVSMWTGGTPTVTGVFYSPMFDRAVRGTVLYIDEKTVRDNTREDSGGGLDPGKLPRDPARDCAPVFPRHLLRVNTAFGEIRKAGGRTAWIDQHIAYNDYLLGPDGTDLDESVALERKGTTQDFAGFTAQDGRRVELLLNQIRGMDTSGKRQVGVPRAFGMGFVSFGALQKSEGYQDANGTPGPKMLETLDRIDAALTRIVGELKAQQLWDSTLLILTSKHGQSPVDLQRRRAIDRNVIRAAVNGVQPGLLAHASLDTIGLVYLKDSGKAEAVAAALRARSTAGGIQKIYVGRDAAVLFNSPATDSRAPDIVIQPELGVFYVDDLDGPAARALLAEHGGMLDEDNNVPLVASFPGASGQRNSSPVFTHQIAPTILQVFGLDPAALRAVQLEGTAPLPGVGSLARR